MMRQGTALPRDASDRLRRIIVNVILAAAAIVFLYPMLQMLVDSFKSNTEIMSNPAGFPVEWTLASYADVVSPERSLLQHA